jgi:hypothetical protein
VYGLHGLVMSGSSGRRCLLDCRTLELSWKFWVAVIGWKCCLNFTSLLKFSLKKKKKKQKLKG